MLLEFKILSADLIDVQSLIIKHGIPMMYAPYPQRKDHPNESWCLGVDFSLISDDARIQFEEDLAPILCQQMIDEMSPVVKRFWRSKCQSILMPVFTLGFLMVSALVMVFLRGGNDFLITAAICGVAISLLIGDIWILKNRIKNGLFGANEFEARELMEYSLDERNHDL